MDKIGIFGGTFDPPHFGHLHLALSLLEAYELKEVWWIPVQMSPFKLHQQPLSAHHRIEMLKRALSPLPFFKLLDIETLKAGPSYTIDTLRKLKSEYPTFEFYLLMGGDAATHFEYWKEPEEVLTLATPLVGSRGEEKFNTNKLITPSVKLVLEKGQTLIPSLEISATNIRNRLKSSLYCGHLVPAKVLDYIEQHHLYSF